MSNTEWPKAISQFWATVDEREKSENKSLLHQIMQILPIDHPLGIYELASLHDYYGEEASAVPLYRQALEAGLPLDIRPQAQVQLASSLRNIGELDASIQLLNDMEASDVIGAAPCAFAALALHDAGQHAEALRIVLHALADTLPMYQRAVKHYADRLVSEQ